MKTVNIEATLSTLKLDVTNYLTVMYSNENDYIRVSLETNEGKCFAIDIDIEDVVFN